MIISFSGAQSTGKTTLLEKCRDEQIFKDFEFIPEVTRLIKRKFDVNINENGDDITQLCIINQHLENYIKHKNSNVVMDRCILDGIVYTQYLYNNDRISEWVLDYAKEMYSKLIGDIDIIFYTNPDIPLVDDGERSINKDFRDDIISIFERYINKLYQNGIEVVDVSGSVEERIKLILKNTIEKLNQ
jgi:nicotinamide riboside kinase